MPPGRRWLAALVALVGATAVAVLVSGGGSRRVLLAPTTPPVPTAPAVPTTPPGPAPPPALPGPPALPPPAGQQFGVNVNRLFNDQTYSVAAIDAQLAAVRATGATIARSDALWEAAEPQPPVGGVHRYQWAFDDLIAGSLAAHGLRWIPIVDYAPSWAATAPGPGHFPPRSDDAFASFAAALAARYGTAGSFWREHPGLAPVPADAYEIWNEPDSREFWQPAPNAGQYAQLYLASRAAIKAVEPGARVIIGGLTDAPTSLSAMVAAVPALHGHVDGVGLHPYGVNPLLVLAGVRSARATLVALGLASVPLYITEFGWPTSPPKGLYVVPADRRPAYIAATTADLGHLDCGVAATLLYTWLTPEHDPRNREDWFGISRPAGGPTPDTQAFALGIRRALAPAPAIHLCGTG